MTAPAFDLVTHAHALAAALAKRRSEVPVPLSAEEVDALFHEIGLLKAQEQLTRSVADKIATTLDAFRRGGARLEHILGDGDLDEGRWRATMLDGQSVVARSPLLALQYVTGTKSDAAQFTAALQRHGLATEAR